MAERAAEAAAHLTAEVAAWLAPAADSTVAAARVAEVAVWLMPEADSTVAAERVAEVAAWLAPEGFTAAGAEGFTAAGAAGVSTAVDPMAVRARRPRRILAADLFPARQRECHPEARATSNASAPFPVPARISPATRSSLLREKLGPLKAAVAEFS